MLPERVICYGVNAPLPERVPLRAGPLDIIWEAGDLRYVRLGDVELLRRIYVAIRDRNWDTAPAAMSNVNMEVGRDTFRITYHVENQLKDINFTWCGEITGTADGTVRLSMDGIAQATFMKNRIGFCVLHPDDIAGARARVRHVDGSIEEGTLPRPFNPAQPVQPFAEMAGIAHEVAPGVWAELRFEGDIFEMEDQRNWTDASYKIFSTPLRLPYPVEVPIGTRICQVVTLSLSGTQAAVAPARAKDAVVLFAVDRDSPPLPLPEIGLSVASHGQPLTDIEVARLAALLPAHLRVDVVAANPACVAQIQRAADEATQLNARLEVALILDPQRAAEELAAFRPALSEAGPRVARWLVFPSREVFTGGTPLREVLEPARDFLPGCAAAPIASGTNTDYIFLARSVPPLDLVDALTFTINPQAHAFDNASIVETLKMQGQAVANARALAQGKAVYVSPVTLKMRHNPYAAGVIPPTLPGQLPPQVDPRQMSLFAAGWTAASIKYIAEAGAAGVTYYETTGWRGVMETAAGSPVPDKFPSFPGAVFPVYHVLADVAEFGGAVAPSRSSDRLAVDGLALRHNDHLCVILANLTGESQQVVVPGLCGEVGVRLLDAENAERAMRQPETFRATPSERRNVPESGLSVILSPYAVARLDFRCGLDSPASG